METHRPTKGARGNRVTSPPERRKFGTASRQHQSTGIPVYLTDSPIRPPNLGTARPPNPATAAITLRLARAFAQRQIDICVAEGVTEAPNFETGAFGSRLPIAPASRRRRLALDKLYRGGGGDTAMVM